MLLSDTGYQQTMHNRFLELIFIVVFSASPAIASSDIDQNEAQVLREQGVIMSLEEILQNVQKLKQGRIMEVELENKHGRYVYEIEIADPNGKVWELKLDASNGSLISQEQDD